MPLVNVPIPPVQTDVPGDVRALLREAGERIEQYQSIGRCPAFVPSDHAGAYGVLRAIAETHLAPGNRFCEWGSGFGVVACLAAQLDYDACGIEIDGDLVAASRRLASDFDLPVEFVCDSFIPPGGEALADVSGAFAWLTTDAGEAESELGLATDDFDVIFAYPWPDEGWVIDGLFGRYAAVGAVLVTYNGVEGFRLRRKMARKRVGR
jgi:hypothetical protein